MSVKKATKAVLRDGPSQEPNARPSRILLFGDSHSHAIQRANEKRKGKGLPTPVSARRLLKVKNGRKLGDTSFEDFLDAVHKLSADDVVLSVIGGNQHSVFSMIQHPQPFDFFSPDGAETNTALEIIPYRALEDAFAQGLRRGDGQSIQALRDATSARVVHVIPPPPKADNAFIEKNHETRFAEELPAKGVSSPALRLKFWQLQARVLESICADIGVEVMAPPVRTVDEHGFLRPEFYAQDATHANWLYGEKVLREIERRFLPQHAAHRGKA
jgi:hypothetical protein